VTMTATTRVTGDDGAPVGAVRPADPRWRDLVEGTAVLSSPAVAFVVLRLRLMAPVYLPDPSMHTTYIVHARDTFARYSNAYAATARLREGARVGFLVPARLAYQAFGAIPGFVVTRYIFALVAVVPVYLLLRRLFGRAAGILGIVVVLGSPVVVEALGSDYPDSAVVAYLIGALACLAMPSTRRRRVWLAAAGGLATMAVWSQGAAIPLVAVMVTVYFGVCFMRSRATLVGDAAILAGAAATVTVGLMVADAVEFGRADFIWLTIQSFRYLRQPSQVALWHSTNWRWAPHDAYLLVPPAVVVAFALTFGSRLRAVPTPQLLVGLVAAGQLVACVYLQFLNHVQMLEQPYFSSTLWASVCLALALVLAEMARPLFEHPLARFLPAVLLVAVVLSYEADPHVPSLRWLPWGAGVAAALAAFAACAQGLRRSRRSLIAYLGAGGGLVGVAGCALALTVAPTVANGQLPGTVFDPPAGYATALGGRAAAFVDEYRVTAQLPRFVGDATYRGEQLLMWWPWADRRTLMQPVGMYHAGFNTLPADPPGMTPAIVAMLNQRRAPELLLLSTTGSEFPAALRALGPFKPSLIRETTLRSGHVAIHMWLVWLAAFAPLPG
jgi:hypothetical protein